MVLASRNIATNIYFTLFDQSLLKSSGLILVPSRYLSVFWDDRRLRIRLKRARGLMGREEGKILLLTITFSICSEMLRFVIIPWRNTSSIPRINWGSFRGRREEKLGSFRGRFGDHFRVGDHFAVGIISGAVQYYSYLSGSSLPLSVAKTP